MIQGQYQVDKGLPTALTTGRINELELHENLDLQRHYYLEDSTR
jgi:hypothetical protein